MTELLYKYDRCSECGREGFQWGIEIEYTTRRLDENKQWRLFNEHIFICHDCVKSLDKRLDDKEEESKHKTTVRSH